MTGDHGTPLEAFHDPQRRVLRTALKRAQLTVEELWLRYFSLGGHAGPVEVDAYLNGLMRLEAEERDLLAQAVNERLDELVWGQRVPYTQPLPAPEPRHAAPLAALTRLLEGVHLSPPGHLPRVVRFAAQALGVDMAVYLVDYDQRALRHLAGGEEIALPPHPLESTMAGRAFRQLEWVVQSGDPVHVWIPLLDGAERLGVLRVAFRNDVDLVDPELRSWIGWFGALLGHLVVIEDQYGDDIDATRRRRPRSVAAELIWQLLPPETFGTERFVVSGLVEPSYDVGGDAFDYALRGRVAHLAIFDATGHSLGAGAAAAVAVSAYRKARRDDAPLYDTVRLIDDVLAEQFNGERYVTAVLAQLDLDTGWLRYVSAGHPAPLVLRDGRVVKTLDEGRRLLLGLQRAELTVAEERLEPGDWLVLYTDGIVEARDPDGEFFGEDRLVDFLEREAATDHPPPEVLRRLVQSVLAHQDDDLQDDATVLLAQWSGPEVQEIQPR